MLKNAIKRGRQFISKVIRHTNKYGMIKENTFICSLHERLEQIVINCCTSATMSAAFPLGHLIIGTVPATTIIEL